MDLSPYKPNLHSSSLKDNSTGRDITISQLSQMAFHLKIMLETTGMYSMTNKNPTILLKIKCPLSFCGRTK